MLSTRRPGVPSPIRASFEWIPCVGAVHGRVETGSATGCLGAERTLCLDARADRARSGD